jgi:YfiH family protein
MSASSKSRRAKRKASSARKKSVRPTPRAARKKSADASWPKRVTGRITVLSAPTLAKLSWAVHGFSTRKGGASKLTGTHSTTSAPVLNLGFTEWDKRETVETNRAAFLRALGASKMRLITLRQVHSDAIHLVNRIPPDTLSGDALITRVGGLLLAVQTADCVPVLLADTKRRAIAAIHAGWRGTLARIVAKTIGRMHMEFGTQPSDICAALGPSIGRCSYEVGPEVAAQFSGQFANAVEWFDVSRELKHGLSDDQFVAGDGPNPLKWLSMMPPGHDPPPPSLQLDLIAANRWQLLDAGVPQKNISDSGICTACNTDLLFSYRREQGRTGRMLAAIGIRE